jgi:hypothetical protein
MIDEMDMADFKIPIFRIIYTMIQLKINRLADLSSRQPQIDLMMYILFLKIKLKFRTVKTNSKIQMEKWDKSNNYL